jgi:hypothetical protein
MDLTPTTPGWAAPRLVRLQRADGAQAGLSYSSVEGDTYSPSAPS